MIDPGLVGLVSAATALVASFAGPVITLHIGRLQIRASVLSVNRQKWIDSFRDAVATFDGRVHVSSEAEVIGRFEALISRSQRFACWWIPPMSINARCLH